MIVTVETLYGNSQDQAIQTLNPVQVIQEVATTHNHPQVLPQVKVKDSDKLLVAIQPQLVAKDPAQLV